MQLIYFENTPSKLGLVGKSLDTYLNYYKIPAKMDGNHDQYRELQITGGDITKYAAYCGYDSICL